MLKPEIQDKRRWWSREDLILLILLGILYFLPGLAQIPLFDRDEPRFATAAREMANSGDYIVPHFNGNLRPDKPPLLYWLMNASYALTGGPSELGARLPSALCGTLTLLVVYFAVGSRFKLDALRIAARKLVADSEWQKLAVSALIEDLYAHQSDVAARAMTTDGDFERWIEDHGRDLTRLDGLVREIEGATQPDLAMLTVANRALRGFLVD